jgi:hypothetical protein
MMARNDGAVGWAAYNNLNLTINKKPTYDFFFFNSFFSVFHTLNCPIFPVRMILYLAALVFLDSVSHPVLQKYLFFLTSQQYE